MSEFWSLLRDPDIPFLRMALMMGLLASPAFGMIGSLVVVKRISYVAGAISHAVLGGIGAALYFQRTHGIEWLHPLLGALAAALMAAVVISLIRYSGSDREDSIIGAIWATGMAAGLVFIANTPGFTDPMSYLFGNLLILSGLDLVLVAVMDLCLVFVMLFGYNRLQAVCFDEEQARLRGINVRFVYTLLLCLVSVAVVLLVSVVGIILVVALLTIPAAMAGRHVRSLAGMMAAASLICAALIAAGLFIGVSGDWPIGPTIILLAGMVFLLQSLFRRVTG